jgi:hypothetical protein
MSDERTQAGRALFDGAGDLLRASLTLWDAAGSEILVDGRLNPILGEILAALTTMFELAAEFDFLPVTALPGLAALAAPPALRVIPPEPEGG